MAKAVGGETVLDITPSSAGGPCEWPVPAVDDVEEVISEDELPISDQEPIELEETPIELAPIETVESISPDL